FRSRGRGPEASTDAGGVVAASGSGLAIAPGTAEEECVSHVGALIGGAGGAQGGDDFVEVGGGPFGFGGAGAGLTHELERGGGGLVAVVHIGAFFQQQLHDGGIGRPGGRDDQERGVA